MDGTMNTHANAELGARCVLANRTEPATARKQCIALFGQFPYLKYRTAAVLENCERAVPVCAASKAALVDALLDGVLAGDGALLMHLECLLQTYSYAVAGGEDGGGVW